RALLSTYSTLFQYREHFLNGAATPPSKGGEYASSPQLRVGLLFRTAEQSRGEASGQPFFGDLGQINKVYFFQFSRLVPPFSEAKNFGPLSWGFHGLTPYRVAEQRYEWQLRAIEFARERRWDDLRPFFRNPHEALVDTALRPGSGSVDGVGSGQEHIFSLLCFQAEFYIIRFTGAPQRNVPVSGPQIDVNVEATCFWARTLAKNIKAEHR